MRVSSFLIFDGAKRRADATSTPITRDHPLQEITHYNRAPITTDHALQKTTHYKRSPITKYHPLQEKNPIQEKNQLQETNQLQEKNPGGGGQALSVN